MIKAPWPSEELRENWFYQRAHMYWARACMASAAYFFVNRQRKHTNAGTNWNLSQAPSAHSLFFLSFLFFNHFFILLISKKKCNPERE